MPAGGRQRLHREACEHRSVAVPHARMALPMIRSAPRTVASTQLPPSRGGSTKRASVLPPLLNDPINILIVDDEPKNLTVLESVLDDPGYRLVRAISADRALLALVEEEFA